MNRILLICMTFVSITAYGQQVRMQADVFAAFVINAEQSHAPAAITVADMSLTELVVPVAPQCEMAQSGNTGSSADVVVQEELVAGRFGDTQLTETKKRFARIRAIMNKPERERTIKERE